jgi:hypothetical protein
MEELISYAQSIIDFLSTSGASLNQVSQQALGSLLQNVLQVIQQDTQEASLTPPMPPEKISLSRPMPSSNIHSFGYDPKNERLLVKFQGDYPDQNGPIYGYDKVPKAIFDMFQKGAIPARTDGSNKWGKWWKGKVPSLGASMYTLIKQGGYQYQRLT